MIDLESKITSFRSTETLPVLESELFELSLANQRDSIVNPGSIKNASFARSANKIAKETLVTAYRDSFKLIYGSKVDQELLNQITNKLMESNRSFNYSLLLSKESAPIILGEVIRREKLFSGELLESFIDDVTRDVENYLSITGEQECALRLVLEDQSSFYDLLNLDPSFSKEALWSKVKEYIIALGYHESFVYHIDDYAINFTKIYSGAPSLAIAAKVDQAKQAGFYDRWVECFNQPLDFHSSLTDSLYSKDINLSIKLISQLIKNINSFQLNPDRILEGETAYQFEVGTPHFYFGLEHELNKPSLLMHARPMIWASDFSAKRFLTLIEPTANFNHISFFNGSI